MRILAIASLALGLFATAASAAETAVSKSTLKDMGLGTMQELAPQEAMAVRGKGAGVWGSSSVTWGPQTSSNFYSAGSSWLGRGSSAGGNSLSFSGSFQFFQFAGW